MRLGTVFSESALSQYALTGFMAVLAVMIGVAVAAEKWVQCLIALLMAVTLFFPIQVAFGLFAMLIPFDSIAAVGDSNNGRTVTWFAGAAAAILLLVAGLVTRRLKMPPAPGIWLTVFIIWCAVTSAWALSPQAAFGRLPTAFSLLALYIASGCVRFTKREVHGIVLLIILGGCVAAIWTVYLYQGNFFDAGARRASLTLGSREANPNELGLSLLLPISLALGYFLSSKRRLNRAAMLIAIAVSTLGLLMTMSRGAAIALAVMLLVYLFRLRIGSRIIIPILVLGAILSFMPSAFFVRFQEASQSGGSGRVDIWKAALVTFKHHALLGAGLENFGIAYSDYAGEATHFMGLNRDSHNVYLTIAVETGVIGLFLFVGAIRSQLRTTFDIGDRPDVYNTLIATEAAGCGALAFGLFGNILWNKTFWLLWILLAAAGSVAEERRKPTGVLSRIAKQPEGHFRAIQ